MNVNEVADILFAETGTWQEDTKQAPGDLRRVREAFARAIWASRTGAGFARGLAPTLYTNTDPTEISVRQAVTQVVRDTRPPDPDARLEGAVLYVAFDQDPSQDPRITDKFVKKATCQKIGQVLDQSGQSRLVYQILSSTAANGRYPKRRNEAQSRTMKASDRLVGVTILLWIVAVGVGCWFTWMTGDARYQSRERAARMMQYSSNMGAITQTYLDALHRAAPVLVKKDKDNKDVDAPASTLTEEERNTLNSLARQLAEQAATAFGTAVDGRKTATDEERYADKLKVIALDPPPKPSSSMPSAAASLPKMKDAFSALDGAAIAKTVKETVGTWLKDNPIPIKITTPWIETATEKLVPLPDATVSLSCCWAGAILLSLLLFLFVGWVQWGDPLAVCVDSRFRLSLSLLQMWGWTLIILSAFAVTSLFLTGASHGLALPTYSAEIWGLMGLAFGSPALSQVILNKKGQQDGGKDPNAGTDPSATNIGVLDANTDMSGWSFMDLFTGEEVSNRDQIDLTRVQHFVITIALMAIFFNATWMQFSGLPWNMDWSDWSANHALPYLNATFLGLLGVSHAGYLVFKNLDKSGTSQ